MLLSALTLLLVVGWLLVLIKAQSDLSRTAPVISQRRYPSMDCNKAVIDLFFWCLQMITPPCLHSILCLSVLHGLESFFCSFHLRQSFSTLSSLLNFSPSPLLLVSGSVLHGRLEGFEVHLEFSTQAPLFLFLFCCNSIGQSHCSARNRISLDEEHHTCHLSPGLENVQLNPKRGEYGTAGRGKGAPEDLAH